MSQIPSHTSIATTGRRPRPVTSGENVIPAENLILEVDDLKSMCADMLSEEGEPLLRRVPNIGQ